jgi:hypothetical protein
VIIGGRIAEQVEEAQISGEEVAHKNTKRLKLGNQVVILRLKPSTD